MSRFTEMEWNAKWDWENLVGFGSKAIEGSKKPQLADWMIVDDANIHDGSFNLSGCGGNSGASGSDGHGGHGSSAKSSISASTDSSSKDGLRTPIFRFTTTSEGASENFSKKVEMKVMRLSGTSPPLEGSAEALLGLKLGKRTYFENSSGAGAVKSASSSVMPTPSINTLKKTKSAGAPICCQVEGCNTDLSLTKEYYRKHRVCDNHSKCPKVIVCGRERRFCQQCSRFHSLSDFDGKKRSCRRRLSDHNARRRKPQQETIQFNSIRLPTSFYGGAQQMSFLLNNSPPVHSRTPGSSAWEIASNSKFTLTERHHFKSHGDEGTGDRLPMSGIKIPQTINMQNAANRHLVSKNSTSGVLNPGPKGSLISSMDAAPEYHRALSLLSSNSWDPCQPESIPLHHQMLENNSSSINPLIHAIPEGVPLSSSDVWLSGQHSMHPHVQSSATNSNFQEIQPFRTPYDADFYSNILN